MRIFFWPILPLRCMPCGMIFGFDHPTIADFSSISFISGKLNGVKWLISVPLMQKVVYFNSLSLGKSQHLASTLKINRNSKIRLNCRWMSDVVTKKASFYLKSFGSSLKILDSRKKANVLVKGGCSYEINSIKDRSA